MYHMDKSVRVSHQWIYDLIHRDRLNGGYFWRYRRHRNSRGPMRKAKDAGLGKIPNRTGIEHRPEEVESRGTLGHWEGDTVFRATSNLV
jgi:IS30 family transposase